MEIHREHQCDLIITDILMAGQEGIETITILRKEFPEVRVIAISGGIQGTDIDFLPLAGMWGAHQILPKPFVKKDLMECIEKVFAE